MVADVHILSVIFATLVLLFIGSIIGYLITRKKMQDLWQSMLPEIRKDAINRSCANLGGKFSENLCLSCRRRE